MAIGILRGSDDDDVMERYKEETPIGAPCKADKHDEFKSEYERIKRRKEESEDSSTTTYEEVKESIAENE